LPFTFFDDCQKKSDDFSEIIIEFIRANPDFFEWRAKIKPNINTEDGRNDIKAKMAGAFTTFNLPSEPKTIADKAVAEILSKFYNTLGVKKAVKDHRDAMAAENFVGYLLELYIFSEAHKFNWCLCPDAIVKSVDFVKQNEDGTWTMLQIKNRDNSENSSSKKVREGTDIQHWFRTFSKKEGSNWNNFPDPELKKTLSEDGYFQFIDDYFKNHPDFRR